ncbi:ATP-binding protein [Nonomuraea sp. NBC_01738]|uniref:ATP-binding protein n=1 Tax=Nonomuraea sp. NBC_01738 TaxID=2976003 RepID=UPI002E0D2BA5|nr:ATP-binding protein [Nonomuraea sp. NBC_01738]
MMTTFDARLRAATGPVPPSWLAAILVDGAPGGREAVFQFHELSAFEPACVATARRFVASTLSGWNAERAVFDTQLVVSELVTNAMRHGGGAVQLRLLAHELDLVCVVTDYSRSAPVPATPGVFAEYGRGLALVEALTRAWGWLTSPGPRKLVWACMAE